MKSAFSFQSHSHTPKNKLCTFECILCDCHKQLARAYDENVQWSKQNKTSLCLENGRMGKKIQEKVNSSCELHFKHAHSACVYEYPEGMIIKSF